MSTNNFPCEMQRQMQNCCEILGRGAPDHVQGPRRVRRSRAVPVRPTHQREPQRRRAPCSGHGNLSGRHRRGETPTVHRSPVFFCLG